MPLLSISVMTLSLVLPVRSTLVHDTRRQIVQIKFLSFRRLRWLIRMGRIISDVIRFLIPQGRDCWCTYRCASSNYLSSDMQISLLAAKVGLKNDENTNAYFNYVNAVRVVNTGLYYLILALYEYVLNTPY